MALGRAVERWLRDGQAQGHSERTTTDRRRTMARFAWWLEHEATLPVTLGSLSPGTIREFLAYLRESDGPRWGSTHPSSRVEVRPATVNAYYRTLRAFANWCREEDLLAGNPMKNVKEPKIPRDQLDPFTEEEIRAMKAHLAQTATAARDTAIFLLLLTTGMRVSELCSLRIGDVSRENSAIRVTGKGNKRRTVYLGKSARRALWRYWEARRLGAERDEALFVGETGRHRNVPLKPNGVYGIISAAAAAAGVTEAHRGPHALRRTFAINFLRNGGNVMELQRILGHEDLTVLQRYVKQTEQDIEEAHRRADPVDRWFG